MKLYRKIVLSTSLFFLILMTVAPPASAQKTLRIAIVHHPSDSVFFKRAVTEIEVLLSHRYALEVTSKVS